MKALHFARKDNSTSSSINGTNGTGILEALVFFVFFASLPEASLLPPREPLDAFLDQQEVMDIESRPMFGMVLGGLAVASGCALACT